MKSRLGLSVCCLVLLSSCGQGDKNMGKAPEFAVIETKTTTANLTNSYPATIKGKQDVEIRPMVSGFITKLHVDEGASVRKGQILFSIDPVQYQATVNSAKAAVETAKAAVNTQELTVNNKRELNKKNIISDYDLQMAENQLSQAKAQLAQAQAQLVNAKNNLSYTSVTSPSDGVIGTIPYRVGSLVSPSVANPLTTVADISEMYAYFSMTERQLLAQIREGGSIKEILAKMPDVQLQLIDGTMYADSGRVETISGVIDPKTGSVTMRALFPNKHNVLRSGSTGKVVFPNPMQNVIMIPQSATTEIQDKKFVFVLQPDNTLKNVEVKIFNLNDGKYYYVTDGLKAGDKIVIEGVQNLKDGQSITPVTPADKEAEYRKALQDQKNGNLKTAFQ
ncbi:efflux RND transporter periplasmic adaptor subunit [Bacteroides helcogenes]|uniref:Efflux transporter, RND family, MFP subunit n=1 Tax=Bacteroides helcogenes (strain ATCC 35417 / DSM 20613 / JCM 6297 / CCUG 15421 / P 36-108) TaxID=693979 RepID=E6SWJ3_BACT6|nr:efflux RND transporter periplasmic adaptor subunit [Bacteroides helcogenes]ADV42591.1 efflux transporter, RND family, MFP subunit [Bacteroides helcogenes P 36-108]MDY5237647.1 efflux RND transporter periplasmic adaptor subunit [Bacteroides helcogenes]